MLGQKKMMRGNGKMLMNGGKPSMEMESSGEGTTLSSENYPELQGMEVGSPISGKWSGKVTAVNGNSYRIEYDEVSLETDNSADRDLRQMSGQSYPEQSGDGE